MDPVEQGLLQALEASPEDWAIRLLIAEKFHLRDAADEAADLIERAPAPPENGQQLQRAAQYAGQRALAHAKAFVANHPSDSYGHYLLGHLLELSADTEKATEHYAVAKALGFSDGKVESDPETVPAGGDTALRREAEPQLDAAPPSSPVDTSILPTHAIGEGELQTKPTGNRITSILVAVVVHVIIGLIAAILIVLPPSTDEPEIVANLIEPPRPKMEMQKKQVVEQVRQSPSAAAVAAAPMAQLMQANAMAKISLPNVTKTSTGPLGMGETNLGLGGVGGVGGSLGEGASFFGMMTGGRLAVVFDVTASMFEANPVVVEEVNKNFSDSQVVCVFGGGFKRDSGRLIPYKENKPVLAIGEQHGDAKIRDAMNKALFSLKRCDSISFDGEDLKDHRQSLGIAIENLINQKSPPDTIFVFSDFVDGVDSVYMKEVRDLVTQKGTKVVFWCPFDPKNRNAKWAADKKHYEALIKGTQGEVKEEVLGK